MSDDSLDPDPFQPPEIPTAVSCLHCGEEYDSYLIEYRLDNSENGAGFWCCPTPGCGGKGFGCDIFPLDPDYSDENGERRWIADEGEGESEEPYDSEENHYEDNGDGYNPLL